jgi:hypothetical protein
MVSPSKLKALVDSHSSAPDMSALAGMPPAPDDDGGLDDDEDPEPTEPVDPLTRGNQMITSWGEQGETLKDAAGEIVDEAHEVGGDLLLATVPEDALEEVEDQFDGMPDDVKVCLAQHVAPLDASDMGALATALIDGHDGETEDADKKLVTTYLTRVAALAKDEVDPEDFVQDEEDDEKDEGDDKEKDGDDADGAAAAAGGQGAAPVDSGTAPLA